MASHMSTASTIYHGTHEYSTFSASTIGISIDDDDLNTFRKYCCLLCRFSKNLILHPVGPFRCIWDIFVMLLLIYTSIEIPFTMSFGQTNTTLYISLCVDSLLLMDIFLNFHTAYFDKYDNLRLVTNKKYICKKYFRTWFIIDFLTCMPFELFFRYSNMHSQATKDGADPSRALTYIKILRVFRLLRIIKILRFLKMLRIFDSFMKQFVLREIIVVMKLLKIICGMLMFAHFAACLWWFVGSRTNPSWIDTKSVDDNMDLRSHSVGTFVKYSYAWYWAVVTLFTTGYGDVVATNTIEQWVCSISILIGTCFFAYFVGTLTVLITEGDKIKSYESDKLEEAQSFCEKKKLPKELTRAVLTHIRYHCTYNYVFDESELLSILPAYLQHDIHTYVSKQFLLQLKIFQNEYIHLPEFIIGLIAVKTKSISCNQSYKLYDIGDIAKEFYIQRTGRSIMCDEKGEIIHKLSRGSVCGEYSSILFKKRKLQIACETWSEFYSICIDDIRQILDLYYPKSSLSKWKQIKKYLRASYKKNVLHSVNINNCNLYNSNRLINALSPLPTILKTKSHSNYEESVHLFNNTRKKYGKNEQLPGFSRPPTMSRVHTPIPPECSDNEDLDDADQNDTKRNDVYEYSSAKNNRYCHSYIHDEENHLNIDKHTNNENDSNMVVQETTRKSMLHKFAAFQIRSNSAVRDSIVVAHAEKHTRAMNNKQAIAKSVTQRASAPAMLLKSNRTKKAGGSQEELIQADSLPSTEMALLRSNNQFHSRICQRPQYEDILDSENSFYSSDSSEMSDDENQTKRIELISKISTKRRMGRRKKGKAGKFGGKGARGGTGKSVHVNQGYKRQIRHKKKSNKVHKEIEDVPKLLNTRNQRSIDDSMLLHALDMKDDKLIDVQSTKSISSGRNLNIGNIIIGSNVETIVDDTNHDGVVTPLTYLPLIQTNVNVECESPIQEENTIETNFDMFGDDAIDTVS